MPGLRHPTQSSPLRLSRWSGCHWTLHLDMYFAPCNFSTSELPKVVRSWNALYISTWKCASRRNGPHFFGIWSSKVKSKFKRPIKPNDGIKNVYHWLNPNENWLCNGSVATNLYRLEDEHLTTWDLKQTNYSRKRVCHPHCHHQMDVFSSLLPDWLNSTLSRF